MASSTPPLPPSYRQLRPHCRLIPALAPCLVHQSLPLLHRSHLLCRGPLYLHSNSAPPLSASLPSYSYSTPATPTSTPSLAVGSPSPPLPDNPGTPHFSFLDSLQFVCVALNKKTLIELTFSPRLKYLCLDHVRCADPLEISSPTLEVLDIRFQTPASIYDVPIQVRSVTKLRFLGLCMELRQAELFTLAGSDKLEEVTLLWNPKVARSEIHQWKHVMSIAAKAITLVIDCWFLQTASIYDLELLGCHGSFFSNLRRLQICGLTSQWLPNLIVTLGNCPILEHLRFQEYYVFAGETRGV